MFHRILFSSPRRLDHFLPVTSHRAAPSGRLCLWIRQSLLLSTRWRFSHLFQNRSRSAGYVWGPFCSWGRALALLFGGRSIHGEGPWLSASVGQQMECLGFFFSSCKFRLFLRIISKSIKQSTGAGRSHVCKLQEEDGKSQRTLYFCSLLGFSPPGEKKTRLQFATG